MLTWLEYHIRRGFTEVFALSSASDEDDDKLIEDVKAKSIKNVNIVKVANLEQHTISDIMNVLYRNTPKIEWVCYLPIDEYLMLVAWQNIQDMLTDSVYKGQKQIVVPVVSVCQGDDQGEHVKHVRNFTIGGCKTRRLHPECMLNTRKTCLPNGKRIDIKSFVFDTIPFTFDKVYIDHLELTNEAIYNILSSIDFDTVEDLLKFIPIGFPQELIDKLKFLHGFIGDDTTESVAEQAPGQAPKEEHAEQQAMVDGHCLSEAKAKEEQQGELAERVRGVLHKVYTGLEYLDDKHEAVLFKVANGIQDANVDVIDKELTHIIADDVEKQKEDYKQFHIYPITIKNKLDELFGNQWVDKPIKTLSSYVMTAARLLQLELTDIDKTVRLVLLLVDKEAEAERSEGLLEIQQPGKSFSDIIVEEEEERKQMQKQQEQLAEAKPKQQPEVKQLKYSDVDIKIVEQYFKTTTVNKAEQDLKAIQAFALCVYGVYIPLSAIKEIVDKRDTKQANLFDSLKDEDKVVFN